MAMDQTCKMQPPALSGRSAHAVNDWHKRGLPQDDNEAARVWKFAANQG